MVLWYDNAKLLNTTKQDTAIYLFFFALHVKEEKERRKKKAGTGLCL